MSHVQCFFGLSRIRKTIGNTSEIPTSKFDQYYIFSVPFETRLPTPMVKLTKLRFNQKTHTDISKQNVQKVKMLFSRVTLLFLKPKYVSINLPKSSLPISYSSFVLLSLYNLFSKTVEVSRTTWRWEEDFPYCTGKFKIKGFASNFQLSSFEIIENMRNLRPSSNRDTNFEFLQIKK